MPTIAAASSAFEDGFGLLGLGGDPASDDGVIGTVVGEDHQEQSFDLASADAHGERGHRQAPPGGLVEKDDRRRDGDLHRRNHGDRKTIGVSSLWKTIGVSSLFWKTIGVSSLFWL
jgi:hypothetical protein